MSQTASQTATVPAVSGEGSQGPAGAARPLRADARRNRDALLAAASELFTARSVDVPLEEIARQAEVGIGTLYRHFPTRDALVEAVYRREVETLCDNVDRLLAAHADAPDLALEEWLRDFAAYVAKKRGMALALKSMLGPDSTLFTESHTRISETLGRLVEAATTAGTIRTDVEPMDLMRGVGGICMATDSPGWRDRTARLVALLMDGLRYGAHPTG